MIRCPKCGTLNRDNSRFCNECGTPLQRTTSVRCPNCGITNPVGNVFCDTCNTRLVPASDLLTSDVPIPESEPTGPKGILLPARSATDAQPGTPESPELPDWLLELSKESGANAPPADDELPPAELPDWLSTISPESPSAPEVEPALSTDEPTEDELPDWMAGLVEDESSPPTIEPAPTVPEKALVPSDMPDWMSEVETDFAQPEEQASSASESPPATGAFPDWLSDMSEEDTPTDKPPTDQMAPEELPDWLSNIPGAAEPDVPEVSEQQPGPEVLPDWLSEITEETGTSEETVIPSDQALSSVTEPASEQPVPDWLSVLQDEPTAQLTSETEDLTEEAPMAAGSIEWLSDEQTPPEQSTSAEAQPDWLADISFEEPQADEGVVQVAPADMPDWMSDAAESEAAATESSDWLADTSFAEQESDLQEDEALVPTELPDWMSDVSESELAEQEALAPSELPDWISDDPKAEPAEEQLLSPAELPDWGSTDDVGTDSFSTPDVVARPELPQWLVASADTESDYTPTPQKLPTWLVKNADLDTKQQPRVAQLPAWILANADEPADVVSGIASERSTAEISVEGLEESQQAEQIEPSGEGIPVDQEISAEADTSDWMASLLEEDLVETTPEETANWLQEMEAQPSATQAVEPDASEVAASEFPDWLSDMESEEGTEAGQEDIIEEVGMSDLFADTATTTSGISAERDENSEELPDWLSTLDAEEPAADVAPAAKEEPEPAEVPDWLTDIAEEPVSSVEQPVSQPELSEELPAWLQETALEQDVSDQPSGSEAESSEEVPAWLAGFGETGEAEGDGSAIFTQASSETAANQAAGPDWLPQTDGAPGLEPAAPAFVSGAMDEAEENATALSVESEAAMTTEEEMPDWLSELKTTTSEEKHPFAEEFPAPDGLALAEVPSWVQELRPPGTGPLPELPETIDVAEIDLPTEAEGGLPRAKIPDWVQELRPTRESEQARLLGPLEQEGPLSGIRGVLSPQFAVDIPDDYQVPVRPEIPEGIVQQAQLWQQLLEQPRGKVRSVAQQRAHAGAGTFVVRLLIGLALIGAAVAGLLWESDENEKLAWLAGYAADTQPSVDTLKASIDALQPGEMVIVAVEYGLAESGEVHSLAETLIEDLVEKQAHIVAVSTLPEGMGLTYELSRTYAISTSTYVKSSYIGVAEFLTRYDGQDVSMILVLASRADRLRWWIEQNAVLDTPLPMAVGMSASIKPLIAPYLEQSVTQGWISGLMDMIAYRGEFRIVDRGFDYGRMLDALMFTHWVAASLMIFGFLYALAAGKKRTR